MITFWFLIYMNAAMLDDPDQYVMIGVFKTQAECIKIVEQATAPGLSCMGETRLVNARGVPSSKDFL